MCKSKRPALTSRAFLILRVVKMAAQGLLSTVDEVVPNTSTPRLPAALDQPEFCLVEGD